MQPHHLRILHISDLHMTATSDWRRRTVLGDEWLANLDALAKDAPDFHLVCFTGDLARTGQPGEYGPAADFLMATLERLSVPAERLFLVPGNHDVDRDEKKPTWHRVRSRLTPEDAHALSLWMKGGDPPRGFQRNDRDAILARQASYHACLIGRLGREALSPSVSPHGRLGYRVPVTGLPFPFPVYVVGLNSAWLCGDDHDAGKLWLTDDQVMCLATRDGVALPGYRIGLMHHPLGDLMDGPDCRRQLAGRVDLLLRGHLHEPEPSLWTDPERALRDLGAGCLYEHDRYPNACELIDVTLDDNGRPLGYDMRFRGWSRRGFWHDDDGLYRGTRNGRLRWDTPLGQAQREAEAQQRRREEFARRIAAQQIFIGRDRELEQLKRALLAPDGAGPIAIGALQGMPGVGKSYLALRFIALYGAAFPGGTIRVTFQPNDSRNAAAICRDLCDELRLPGRPGAEWGELARYLRGVRALLLVENADDEGRASVVAELARHLSGAALIVTGRFLGLGHAGGWTRVTVRPFEEAEALQQLAQEHRPPANPAEVAAFRALVMRLGYLPLAIHVAAGYLARPGSTPDGFLRLLEKKRLVLGHPDPADFTHGERARAILATTFELSLDALRDGFAADGDRLADAFVALGHAPLEGFGRSLGAAIAGLDAGEFEALVVAAVGLSLLEYEGPPEHTRERFRLHPLLAELLRGRAAAEPVVARMTEWFLARLPEQPGDQVDEQGRLWGEIQSENAGLVEWLQAVAPHDLRRVEHAGSEFAMRCGPFRAWLRFCEYGLQTTSDPDIHSGLLLMFGRVAQNAGELEQALDAARLKIEVDQSRGDAREIALAQDLIADVLQERGQLDEALRIRQEEELPIYERLGDLRGRVTTLGQIVHVLESLGHLDEALRVLQEEMIPAFERLGDMRARAVAMGQIAIVLQRQGHLDKALCTLRDEALPAFEQLGEVRARMLMLALIAGILQAKGESAEALCTLRDEALPASTRLGDIRMQAVILSMIAGAQQERGQLDEASSIWWEQVLPVTERLGDVRLRTAALGHIAEVLEQQGMLDEALRIWREEVLSTSERLGLRGELFWGRGHMARKLLARNAPGDHDEAIRFVRLALDDARAMRIPEAGQIEAILQEFG